MTSGDFGRKAITIFLIALAAFIFIFIYGQGLGSFKSSRAATEKTMATVDCVGEVYSIDSLGYNGGALSFRFNHASYSGAEDIFSITVVAENTKSVNVSPMLKGMSKTLRIENISVGSNFSVYTDTCYSYKVVCDMERLICQ